MARGATEIVKIDVLARTPLRVILMLFIATSLYVTSKGLASISRVLEVVLLFFLPVVISLHILMFSGGDKYNLLPFYNPSKTATYLKAVPMTLPACVGFEVLAVLPFQPDNLKRGRRYARGGVAAVGALYILIVESCYSILGLADIVNYSNALVVAIRRIDAPYLEILRRVDLVFLVAWMIAILCTLNIYNYCFHSIACELFPRVKRWLMMVVLGTLAFAAGTLPSGYDANEKVLEMLLYTLAPLTGFIAPALLIMTRIRKDVVPKNN